MERRAPALGFIFLTLLLDTLGFGLLIPVGPHWIQQLQGGTEGEAAHVVGFLAATYAAMQFVFAPLLGALSDRFGRRPVLLVAMFGSGLDYFAMTLVPSVGWLFLTRALNGLTGASITPASAYIADITAPEKRAAGFGIIGAAFGLGFVLGPLVGGFLGEIDVRYPFYAAGTITLANWLYGWFVLPESLPPERRSRTPLARNPLRAFAPLFQYPHALRLAAAMFLLNMAQFALHATWVLHGSHRYGWSTRDAGLTLFAVGLGAAIVQGGLARRIIPRLGNRRSLLLGVAIGTLAYAGYALAEHSWMIYAVIAFASIGGIAMPACQSIVTGGVRHDQQGAVQGGITSSTSLANMVGPLIGSSVFAWSIEPDSGRDWPGLVFFVCAGIAAIGWLVAAWALRIAPAGTAR